MEMLPLTYAGAALRILCAIFIGGLLGLDRGLKNRPAGMRTYMLVCVGSCLIMLTNQFIYQSTGTGDPVRMGAQVVSGIGFLGAGTIIVTRRSQIKGLTTAAGLWAAAGVGLALGVGFYFGAALGGAAIFGVMTLLHRMDNKLQRNARTIEVYVEMATDFSVGDFLRELRLRNLELHELQREHDAHTEQGVRAYLATLRAQRRTSHIELLEDLTKSPALSLSKNFERRGGQCPQPGCPRWQCARESSTNRYCPSSARYRYCGAVGAKTKAPLVKGGCLGTAEAGGFRRQSLRNFLPIPSSLFTKKPSPFHMGWYFGKAPTVNPSVTAAPCQLPLTREPLGCPRWQCAR